MTFCEEFIKSKYSDVVVFFLVKMVIYSKMTSVTWENKIDYAMIYC